MKSLSVLAAGLLLGCLLPLHAEEKHEFRGAAVARGAAAVLTWGDGVWRWPLNQGPMPKASRLLSGQFGEGGCQADVNGDGQLDLVLEERPTGSEQPDAENLGRLVWFEAPSWRKHVLDTGIDMSECQETTLLGRRGLLIVQRHAQVRFYTYPPSETLPSPYQEVYSFYTPSRQAGLLRADIDGDGREDILCGNYWIQSPAVYTLPWRLFAIELYNETEQSATLRLALLPGPRPRLAVAQRDMADARVAVMSVDPAAGVKALWIEQRLEAPGGFHHPRGLLTPRIAAQTYVVVAEDESASSRLLVFREDGSASHFTLQKARLIAGAIHLLDAGPYVALILHDHVEILLKSELFTL